MVESSLVQWGQTAIPYAIRRSGRRRTVSIAVEPTGDVVLTAPHATPVERLDRLVRDKARWIVDQVRARGDVPHTTAREFVSGETFHYLGRSYRLNVISGAGAAAAAALDRYWLRVEVPTEAGDEAAAVRSALVAWYKRRAAIRLPDRVAFWAGKLRLDAPTVLIRDPRKRWGSCDANGTLRLNWRVVQAPMRLVDYVIAHELVHLEHDAHDHEFWRALGRVMPDYERRRDALRRLGPRLGW